MREYFSTRQLKCEGGGGLPRGGGVGGGDHSKGDGLLFSGSVRGKALNRASKRRSHSHARPCTTPRQLDLSRIDLCASF